jgi:hypothetical protein
MQGCRQEDREHFVDSHANSFHHEGNPKEFNLAEISQLLESIFQRVATGLPVIV